MRLHLHVSMPDDAPLVDVLGEVDLLTADDLYEFLATVICQRGPRLSVDMGGVSFMDSIGLTALLRARDLARSHGGNLSIVSPSPPVARVLRAALTEQALIPSD